MQPRLMLAFGALAGIALAQPFPGVKQEQEEDEIVRKRDEWFRHQREYPGTHIPVDARMKAIELMERMMPRATLPKRASSTAAAISATQWTSIGPQPIGSQPNPYAGRVFDLVVDPRNPNVAYAGIDNGGVWKTTDGGVNWLPLTDKQPCMSIRSLALDPSRPDTVYAGTGSGYYGCGILKSADGGATWSSSSQAFVGPGYYLPILSLAVHPTSSQIILASAGSIYRSTDGGTTWAQTNSFVFGSVYTIRFDASNGLHAWAAADGGGVYQSFDAGLTWTPTNGTGVNKLPTADGYEFGFAAAPSNSTSLYVSIRDASRAFVGFYKSVDGGSNWVKTGNPQNDNPNYWRWTLSVHPSNPNIVFAGLLSIYRSTDGGQTWPLVSGGDSPHVDQHVQAFSSDGSKVYAGNDGGVWSASPPTATTPAWMNLNQTFSTVLFNPGFALHPTDATITLAGTQDNGTLNYQGALRWPISVGGDGGWAAIDFQQPTTMYHTFQWPSGVQKLISGGSWQPAMNGINTGDLSSFYPPLVMDPSDPQRLYFGTYRLYRSSTGAGAWSAISQDLSGGSTITAIGVAPSDGNTVYTGSCNAAFVSRNATVTATWKDVTSGLPNRCATQVSVDPRDAQTAWITYSGFGSSTPQLTGHVYKTTNAGTSWTNVSGNLPDIPVNDVVVDPDLAGTLYAATDIGVFRTSDGGASWLPFGAGLPNVVVNAIRLHEPSRTLRAATFGRGMWDIAVPTVSAVRIGITASAAGASFSLEDGSTYTAPATLSLTPGSKHTITWLTATTGQTGTHYVFQSWTDGGTNPRTITVPSSDTVYSASLQVQYQVSITVVPTGVGTVNVNPSSPDGYYNAGTVLQVSAISSTGYAFTGLTDSSQGTPLGTTLTINGPLSATANFSCALQIYSDTSIGSGPMPGNGILEWETGAACSWTLVNNIAWLSTSGSLGGTARGVVSYSIAANPGGAIRTGTLLLSAVGGSSQTITITQAASASSKTSIVSLTPNVGAGQRQIFTLQAASPAGYGAVNYAYLLLKSYANELNCYVSFSKAGTQWTAQLENDAATGVVGTILVPSSDTLSNSKCRLEGSQFSITGSNQTANISVGLTFLPLGTGRQLIFAAASDSAGGLLTSALIGHWTAGAVGFIDGISNGSGSTVIPKTGTLNVSGWAADPVTGAPVTSVAISIDGVPVGGATLGGSRPDIAAMVGRNDYTNSGWLFQMSASGLTAGPHTLSAVSLGSSGPTQPLGGPNSFTVSLPSGGQELGHVDVVSNGIGGTLTVAGWAADTVGGSPVTSVTVSIDGTVAGTAVLGVNRSDVAAAFGRPDYTNSGWSFQMNTSALSAGTHAVSVVVVGPSGTAPITGASSFTVIPPVVGKIIGNVDAVGNGSGSSTITKGGTLSVGGWAADTVSGSPVTRVTISIDGAIAGTATLGGARPDVAAAYGRSDYSNSGWSFQMSTSALTVGAHTVSVAPASPSGTSPLAGASSFSVAPAITGRAIGNVDAVGNGSGSSTIPKGGTLSVVGWTADTSSGAPVTSVTISIDGTVAGTATLGGVRADVAAVFSRSDFTNSGWSFQMSTSALSAGNHVVSVVAASPSGTAPIGGASSFTITGPPVGQEIGNVDSILNSSGGTVLTKGGIVTISGWAADTVSGSPVTRINISINGAVVGTATLGLSRPDVASALGRSDYANSGWTFQMSTSALATGPNTVTVTAVGPSGTGQLSGVSGFTLIGAVGTEIGYVDSVGNGSGSTTIAKGGTLFSGGWAADTVSGSPVTRVTISIDGVVAGNATLGGSRSDVASALGRSDYVSSGWGFQMSTSGLAPGPHILTAVAVGPSGMVALTGASGFTLTP